jgi:AcrR family transcriptional regulator
VSTKTRMPGQERREAIVEAAKNLFAQRGFRGTTTRELAAAVGVTEPVLYQHFQTKRELYTAIIDQKSQEVDSKFAGLLREAGDAKDDLAFFRTLAALIMRWYTEDPAYVRLLLYSALEGHELASLCYERQAVHIFRDVADLLRRRMEAGTLRDDVDPLIAARAFIGMVGNFAQGTVIFHLPSVEGRTREEVLDSMVEIFLNGIRKTGGTK